jgi:hypothetical protein
MSANIYTIESLLVGKTYHSKTLTGEIISAEPHPKGVWYEGCESYLVEVRDSLRGRYAYRTLAVKVGA